VPTDSTAIAERIMYELLGRRWVWPPLSVTEEYENVRTRRVHLQGRPIISVEEITLGGTVITDYAIENHSTIRLPRNCGDCLFYASSGWIWTGQGAAYDAYLNRDPCATLVASYTYGAPAPESVEKAIKALECELDLAFAGSGECRLPSRVTHISRQGIDMTLLDPQDFLENGKTGLVEVDEVLAIFNPTVSKTRARVFSPEYLPGRRVAGGS
jgi:hypothetical protein